MLEMGVNTPKAFQASPTRSIFLNVRYDDRLVIADHDMGYPALSVNQEADLTADFKREFGNGLGELWRDDKGRWGFPAVEIVQAANLARLQPTCLSIKLDEAAPRFSVSEIL